MAEICCDVSMEACASSGCESSSRAARRRRMEMRRFKFVGGAGLSPADVVEQRRRKLKDCPSGDCGSADRESEVGEVVSEDDLKRTPLISHSTESLPAESGPELSKDLPKFGVASVCGRRRDMEDTVAVHPSFCVQHHDDTSIGFHYYAVYDGHGCSHVAMRCKERLHELVREEMGSIGDHSGAAEWKDAMVRSFWKMDREVVVWNENVTGDGSCRCELQSPDCDAVGSTAVVAIVTPTKVVVANCGDSRAVLSRNGKGVPLSQDHKPDRPDEMERIHAAGGRVIYWDGPRVLGVLAMSRAIGDNYLKPYVTCEPEVTIRERTPADDCLILASDGLWDVVSNDTACGVARMCLRGKVRTPPGYAPLQLDNEGCGGEMVDKACSNASTLLTQLALARYSSDNVSVVVVDLRRSMA